MLHVFGGIKDFVSRGTRSSTKPDVEGLVARLHHRVTAVLLLVCCLLVTAIEYVGLGTHISCVQEGLPDYWPIPSNVMDTYCFITSTFILPRHLHGAEAGIGDKVYSGVGAERPGEEREYKAYYQWVPFVLFLQCCMFYAPHILFKMWEEGKVQGIMNGLHQPEALIEEEDRLPRHRALARYFMKSLHTHNTWAGKLLLADLLLGINVIGNIYFIDFFLGGEFSTYGLQVASFIEDDPTRRTDPMTRVFPRMTKCIYKKFGASGTIQTHDALCLLPINIINEKIYVFLWFWLVFLAMLTVVSLLLHAAQALVPSLVATWIKRKARHRIGAANCVDQIGRNLQLGDWKLLNVLATNMPGLVLVEFLAELSNQLPAEKEGEKGNNNEQSSAPLLTSVI